MLARRETRVLPAWRSGCQEVLGSRSCHDHPETALSSPSLPRGEKLPKHWNLLTEKVKGWILFKQHGSGFCPEGLWKHLRWSHVHMTFLPRRRLAESWGAQEDCSSRWPQGLAVSLLHLGCLPRALPGSTPVSVG